MSFKPTAATSFPSGGTELRISRRPRWVEIPGYEIECQIGRGGMATVFRAVQVALHRQVAIKVLDQEPDGSDFAQRFQKEGHILAQLIHPNIITIYDIGISEDQQLYLSVEYLSGGTLKDKIKQGLSLESIIEITRSIAKALAYAHERGIVHRDIKPSNIMFRHNETPVLTDFGVARVVDSQTINTIAGLTIGSPGYMSPEQILGERATTQSDLYGLGVILFEMLTGRSLYYAGNSMTVMLKHLHEPVPLLPVKYSNFQPILSKLLAKKSADRYISANDFLQEFEWAVAGDTESLSRSGVNISEISLVDFASSKVQYYFKKRKRFYLLIFFIIVSLLAAFLVPRLPELKNTEFFQKDLPAQTSDQNVEELLKKAEAQLRAGQLTGELDKGNAEATYRKVLRLDPGNREALQGLQHIADEYAKQAQQQFDAGEWLASLNPIYQGLAVAPGHHELRRLQDAVNQKIAEEKVRQTQEEEQRQRGLQAEHFLTLAGNSFGEGSLEVSSAYIEQGLLAVADHQGLLALRDQVRAKIAERQQQAEAQHRQEIEAGRQAEIAQRKQEANRYLVNALQAQLQDDYTASLQQVEQGLALVPDHEGLIRLRGEVREQFAQEQERQAAAAKRAEAIKTLMEQAEIQLAADRLTRPLGDNAEETYRQLLELDPENAQAQAGFTRIADQYVQLAGQRREVGALQDSLALIDRGLSVAPEHKSLLRLRQEINAEWEAQLKEQQRREQEQEAERRKQQAQEAQRRREQEQAAAQVKAEAEAHRQKEQATQARVRQEQEREAQRRQEREQQAALQRERERAVAQAQAEAEARRQREQVAQAQARREQEQQTAQQRREQPEKSTRVLIPKGF